MAIDKTSDYQAALRLVIEDRMKRCGWQRNQLATAAFMRSDCLSRIMRGIRPVTPETMKKLAFAFQTTAGQLHQEARALCE